MNNKLIILLLLLNVCIYPQFLKIKFTPKMDIASILNSSNYKIYGSSGDTINITKVELIDSNYVKLFTEVPLDKNQQYAISWNVKKYDQTNYIAKTKYYKFFGILRKTPKPKLQLREIK